MPSGFTKATDDLVERFLPRIGPSAFTLYIVLKKHANRKSECWPEYGTLAEEVGCCRQRVADALKVLVEVGLLSVSKRGHHNLYVVHPSEEVEVKQVWKSDASENQTSLKTRRDKSENQTSTSLKTRLVPCNKDGTIPIEPDPLNQTHVVGGAVRATRLPSDWCLPDDWRAIALEMRPTMDVDEEAAKFADYWCAKGRDAAKTDWLRTWRNWVRNARIPVAAEHGRNGTNGTGGHVDVTEALLARRQAERAATQGDGR